MRDATLHNVFVGEGNYDLRIGIDELIILQEKLGVGPWILTQRLMAKEWMVQDIIEVIRLALIGGGMKPQEAKALVENYVKPGYLFDYESIAANAMMAALMGVEDEPLEGESDAPAI